MKRIILIALALAVLIAGYTASSLAGHPHHGCDKRTGDLSAMDTDHDGLVSLDEFTEAHVEKYRGWFEKLDTDDDGFLSQEEWDTFMKDHGHGEGS